jgi:hypothetical protein
MMRLILTTCFTLILSIIFSATHAQEYAMIKLNTASVIKNNDFDASRIAAIAESRKRCIKKIIKGDLLPSSDFQKHLKKIEAEFIKDPDPYIARFDIENEEIIDDGQRYQVSVAAKVRKNAVQLALIEKNIVDVFSIEPKPTVMVLVRERFETRATGTRTVETEMIKLFQEKGFKVIDPEQKKLVDMRNRLFSQGTGDIRAALQAAMSFKADYLVFGEAAVTSSGPLAGTDLKARYANLSLKIVESSSGRILATEKGQGKTKHIDELTGGNWALEAAAQKVGKQVLDQFASVLKDELNKGAEYLLDFYGIDYESQAGETENALREIEDIGYATRRFYMSGVAQFEVKYKGSAASLAEAIKFMEIDGQGIEVLETLPRYLRIKRFGGTQTANPNAQELYKKYLEQKYEEYDLEKLREKDKELISQINKLAKSTKISDEQKKQLYATKKEIKTKEKEAFYRQQEMEKRKAELQKAESEKQQLEQALQNTKEELKEERRRLENEVSQANQRAYTAGQNYGNAAQSSGMSFAEGMSAVNQGFEMAQSFNSLLGGF